MAVIDWPISSCSSCATWLIGISVSSGADVSENRVYGNAGVGISGWASEGFNANVVYSNPTNVQVSSNTVLRNNLIYDGDNYGVVIAGTSGTQRWIIVSIRSIAPSSVRSHCVSRLLAGCWASSATICT